MNKYLLKLLIVDDKPAEREGIRNIVNWNSIGIDIGGEAQNGMEGIEKAKEIKPDIIITDIVMPQADGFKMIEEIKKFIPDVKVVFISCFDNFNFAKAAIGMNAYGYVLKPIITGELLATISKITGIHIREIERKKEEEDLVRGLRESLPILKDQFFKNMLYGFLRHENEIWDKNDFLETRLIPGGFTVLVMEIDNPAGDKTEVLEEEKQLDQLRIMECITQYCSCNREGITFCITSVDKSRFAIIINVHDHVDFSSCNEIEVFSDNLKKYLLKGLQLEATIGISSTTNCVININKCYQEACDALKFKSYLGRNQTIKYADIYKGKNTDRLMAYNAEAIQNEVRYLIMSGERNEIDLFVEKLFELNTSEKNSQYAQYTCISVISFIQITLIEISESLHEIFGNEFVIFEKLFRFETILEVKQCLKNTLWSVSSYLNTKDRSKNRKVIEAIKDYIQHSYTKDLTVSDIAEQVYLSPCYTNYIFKKVTGNTLMDYLAIVRIEEAKRLLRNSLLKVYEIAEKVGYKSNSYFSAVFKESCGMTPLEYRDGR
jgi:two-component system, response regulator YesN